MLFETTTTDNLVMDQALHTNYVIEPTTQTYTRNIGDIVHEQQTTQYRATASLQGSYRYVGMTYAGALSAVDDLTQAYSHNVIKWSVGLSSNPETGEWGYQYLPTLSVSMQGANVTPNHMEGRMWEVQVDVNANVEYYYYSPPTIQQVKNQVSQFATSDSNLSSL